MKALTYRPHQARRARQLMANEAFHDANGQPDYSAISREVGVSLECVKYILLGELPAGAVQQPEDIFE